MSKAGMLGLLEGVGSGMASMGGAIVKNSLIEAQDRRAQNREKLRREWATEQDNARYERTRADQLTDQETAKTNADEIYTRNRADKETDTKANQAWQLENRAPSAFKEKVNFFDEKLKDGSITQEQYDVAIGLTKAPKQLTAKERAEIEKTATELAYTKVLGPDSIGKPTPEQVKEIERYTVEYKASFTGQEVPGGEGGPGGNNPKGDPTRQPNPEEIETMFASLMKQDPKTWDQEINTLRQRGYTQASDMLREKLQGERHKLKEAEDQAAGEDRTRINSYQNNRNPSRQPGGLLESGHISTLH